MKNQESLAKTIKTENGTVINLDKANKLWLNEFRLNGAEAMDEDGAYYLTEGTIIFPDGKMENGY